MPKSVLFGCIGAITFGLPVAEGPTRGRLPAAAASCASKAVTAWKLEARGEGAPSTIVVHADTWHATFSTEARGEPLGIATYVDAQRAGEEASNHAGLNVSNGDIACDTVNGRFSVLELETIATDAAPEQLGNVIVSLGSTAGTGPRSAVVSTCAAIDAAQTCGRPCRSRPPSSISGRARAICFTAAQQLVAVRATTYLPTTRPAVCSSGCVGNMMTAYVAGSGVFTITFDGYGGPIGI